VEVTRLPTTLAYHAVAAVDNALYVCGGEDSAIAGVRGLMSLWSFDPSENQWESLADMQQGRFVPLNSIKPMVHSFRKT